MSESNEDVARRRSRRESETEGDAHLVAYVDQDGVRRAVTGDEDAPYFYALGRASSDGSTGATSAKDGSSQLVLVDERGALYTRPAAVSRTAAQRYGSTALEGSEGILLKSSPGAIWEARMLVTTGVNADRWLMVFDRTTTLVTGDAPIWRALLPNPGGSRAELSESLGRVFYTTSGLSIAISTTEVTLTLPASDEALFHVVYE